MKVAAIDIGTNTVLMLIAARDAAGATRAIAQRATITRLGAGVDRTRQLAPEAIARTVRCLEAYASEARAAGVDRVAVVGTSAMRDAGGGEAVRRAVHEHFGVEARVISGDEEARLTFRGALAGLSLGSHAEELAVFDIGGGSTEVVIGRLGATGPSFARSFDVGSVRLTERHGEDRAAIARVAAEAFAALPRYAGAEPPIGVAGTMTTLAAVALGLAEYRPEALHGHAMSRGEVEDVVARLAALAPEARRRVPGLDPGRADVIVAGGTLALALLDAWGSPAVRISDGGVRWGLAEDLLDASEPPPR